MSDPEKAIKKLHKRISSAVEDLRDIAYLDGYENGYSDGTNDSDTSFEDGVNAERERIKAIFDLNIQWALESNKGSEVVFFTKAKQIIEPVDISGPLPDDDF